MPPQKWMNFYTKVVMPFIAAPNLKITVHVEAPVGSEEAKVKLERIKPCQNDLYCVAIEYRTYISFN